MGTLPNKADLQQTNIVNVDQHHKRITTNSLQVAKHFDKRPSNVNQRIASLVKRGRLKVKPSYYLNKQGKQQKYYELNRDHFLLVVLGFTGDKADGYKADFIQLFNQVEEDAKQWQAHRQNVIEPTKTCNDSTARLILELKKEIPESRKPELLYNHIQKAVNKAATGNANTKRAEMNSEQLKLVKWLEVRVHEEIERMRALNVSAVDIRQSILDTLKANTLAG
ncbi:MAG: Rha family transcriptional regulator [Cycloclasticus sp.]|nr:Rha family transcriptional regulator [Cycloclasticus sp.]